MVSCNFGYWTECRKCHARMLLLEPILEGTLQHLGRWSRNDWYINLLCPTCGHGYLHSETPPGDTVVVDDPGPGLHPLSPTVFRVVFECAGNNCESPLICHAFRDTNATVESVIAELPKWETAGVDCRCLKGHAPRHPLQFRNQPFFVPLWE